MGKVVNRKTGIVIGCALVCILLLWGLGFGFGHETRLSKLLGGATFLGSEVYLGTWFIFLMMIPIGFGIPLLVIHFVLREDVRSYGLQLGDVKAGVVWLLALIPVYVLVPLASAAAGTESYYAYLLNPDFLRPGRIAIHLASFALFAFGFEFLFRGFVLFGLNQAMGDSRLSRWLATILSGGLSALSLIGLPWVFPVSALVSSIPGALLNFRLKSVLYFAFVHWNLGVWSDIWEIIKLNISQGIF